MGRPSTYSEEVAAEICARMLQRDERGRMRSVRSICRDDDMPSEGTVFLWLSKHETFSKMYARAREERAHMAADDILEIADTAIDANLGRLRVDARKWYAGKLNAKHYGEKVTNEVVGPDGAALVPVINVTVGRDQSKPAS